jgi:chemotaxis protein histidine kinase CheA
MAAVAAAVAQCHGTISVRSGHNAGTTIRIAIPKPPAQA